MKKKILVFILYYSGITWLKLLWLKIFGSRKLRILAYHRVMDINPEKFDFDDDLIDATVSNFDNQMQFISRHFNVIAFKELPKYVKKGKLPKNSLIITFDDGYKDNYTNAYPILRKYGLSATIFLATDYIDGCKIFWWDAIAYCIKNTIKKEVSFALKGHSYTYNLSTYKKKLIAVKDINKIVNQVIEKEGDIGIEEILKQFEDSLDVKLDPSIIKDHILSWEDIKEMLRRGIEFGAHSVRHEMLTRLSKEEIKTEIIASKQKIEQELSEQPIVFSYPAGFYNNDCIQILKDAGIEFSCTYNLSDINTLKFLQKNPYILNRINIDFDYSMIFFKVVICFPRLTGFKKNNIFEMQ